MTIRLLFVIPKPVQPEHQQLTANKNTGEKNYHVNQYQCHPPIEDLFILTHLYIGGYSELVYESNFFIYY